MTERNEKWNCSSDESGADPQPSIALIEGLLLESESVFVKKLSRNDRSWSWDDGGTHQAGIYIPALQRDSEFFPGLELKQRAEGGEPIREVFFATHWPQTGQTKESRLVHYTSKGEETHLTRLPRQAFAELGPASYLLIGKVSERGQAIEFRCLAVDAAGEEADFLEEVLSLPPDFNCEVIRPSQRIAQRREKQLSFLELALKAFSEGQLAEFSRRHATIPKPNEMAAMARAIYCERNNLRSLNPFALLAPGDTLREISRGVEWELFKDFQLKARSLELVRLIVGFGPEVPTIERVITAIVDGYQGIDSLMLSASQQRKSRAGTSFENHIEQMLQDGRLPFQKQVFLPHLTRPDFVLPSYVVFKDKHRDKHEALVLSLKTTLRERWKQVPGEIENCELFLATVDEKIAGNALNHMRSLGITLVVPEKLKTSKIAEYDAQSNVIDFKTFFEGEIRASRMPGWVERGYCDPIEN